MSTPVTGPRSITTLTLALMGLIAIGTANAEAKTSTVTLKLLMAQAYQDNTTPAPDKDAACQAKYKALFQQEVVNTYDINANTGRMSASATFKGVATRLFPLGLARTYAFMSDGVPPELQKLGLMRIVFQIDKEFAMPRNMLLLPLETGYNCALTNGFEAASVQELLKTKPKK